MRRRKASAPLSRRQWATEIVQYLGQFEHEYEHIANTKIRPEYHFAVVRRRVAQAMPLDRWVIWIREIDFSGVVRDCIS